MNKFTISVITAAVASYAGLAAATGVTGNVTLASDYLFRGISQTDESPAIQGSLTFNHDLGFYVGAWASNVDFNEAVDRGTSEWDVFVGWSGKFPGLQQMGWDVNVLGYIYPDHPSGGEYDYVEFTPALSYDFGVLSINGKVSYSPDFFGAASEDAWYTQANMTIPLAYNFTIGGHVGYQSVDINGADDVEYFDYNLSLGVKVEGVDLALMVSDTDLNATECAGFAGDADWCDTRAVFTIGKTM